MATFTPEQFIIRMNEALNETIKALPSILDKQANDAKALIRNRFTQKGLRVNDAGEEISFPAYSPEYDKKKTKEGKQGAGTPNKILYTGDTLSKLQIINRIKTDKNYTVVLGASDAFSEQKLEWNSERYGDLLRLSKKEEAIITEAMSEEILETFVKEFNK